ncbi:hypothetical protein Aple_072030 [Acrocarpospora pleiomorpha]|uniref:Carrier domain-containing protein n=1 Tax=Acrocarpospora pleiomorpha TaxID=90975 RepID=A0A5M3XSN9_9ACTN|nr:non-ribosomal peptide synthetase [Acrocarpospora pleiomorpha]GES24304.1 hypothetical protein Aple_072030 [Acrocarpospora pleiomorpha]
MNSVVAVPASYAQERFWFLEQLAGGPPPHTMHLALEFSGSLDVPAFRAALQRVVARHESLRTTLRPVGGRPHQVIADELVVALPVIDIAPGQVEAHAAEHARRAFDGPLLRSEMLRIAPDRHVWLLAVHHAICDGWSVGVLLDELSAAYRGVELPPIQLQYADHALWQRALVERGELDRGIAYWAESLAGAPPLLELPVDRRRPSVRGYQGALLAVDPPPAALAVLARELRATPYTAMLAAFALLLHRVSGAEDLVIGTTHAGRDRPETEALIGCFANTLPLRVQVRPREGFRDLLARVRETVLAAHEHASVPFDRIVHAVNPTRTPGHNPLFQVMLDAEPLSSGRLHLDGVEITPLTVLDRRISLFDLSLTVTGDNHLLAEYSTELFETPTATSLLACLRPLLSAAVTHPNRPITELPLLNAHDRAKTLATPPPSAPQSTPEPRSTSALGLTPELGASGASPLTCEPGTTSAPQPAFEPPTSGAFRLTPEPRTSSVPRFTPEPRTSSASPLAPEPRTSSAPRPDPELSTPSPVAVMSASGPERLTYAELGLAADRLARQLGQRGVGAGSLVAVCCDRSPEAIIAIQGVLRAGAAYLAIELDQPAERIADLLGHAAPAAVLTTARQAIAQHATGLPPDALVVALAETSHQVRNSGTAAENALVVTPTETWAPGEAAQVWSEVGPDDLAYVMFTSGSTGRPKGVEVTRGGLEAYVAADLVAYGLNSEDRVLQFGSLGFDLSAEEIFPCLAAGAALVLRSDDMLDSPQIFLETVARLGVTVAHLPTSYLNLLCAAIAEDGAPVPELLRLVVIGSEPADPAQLARWRQVAPSVRLAHAYGVTEASMVSAIAHLDASADRARVTIGRAIPGTEIHLLDRELEPVPDGVPGEIHIGGLGLARGYLRAPGATADRFIPHPFATGRRLYRTGDIGRRFADGSLEFVRRADNQISLRGYRIEPAEPESILRRHRSVRDAAVTVRGGNLVAYLVPSEDGEISAREIRAHAARLLPGHLVPAAYVWLPALPRTGSGKIDPHALPDPVPARADRAELSGQTQHALAEIWCEVLGVAEVGPDDDFFELGGHSLLAAQAAARMRRRLGVGAGVRLIFQHPRLADVADAVDRATASPGPEIATATRLRAGRALAAAVGDTPELAELLRGLGGDPR